MTIYCTASGNIDTGIYAPIRKPIAALSMPVTAECTLSDRIGVQIRVLIIEAESALSATMPAAANTSPTVIYQPVRAIYTKHTISTTSTIASVIR